MLPPRWLCVKWSRGDTKERTCTAMPNQVEASPSVAPPPQDRPMAAAPYAVASRCRIPDPLGRCAVSTVPPMAMMLCEPSRVSAKSALPGMAGGRKIWNRRTGDPAYFRVSRQLAHEFSFVLSTTRLAIPAPSSSPRLRAQYVRVFGPAVCGYPRRLPSALATAQAESLRPLPVVPANPQVGARLDGHKGHNSQTTTIAALKQRLALRHAEAGPQP